MCEDGVCSKVWQACGEAHLVECSVSYINAVVVVGCGSKVWCAYMSMVMSGCDPDEVGGSEKSGQCS